MLVLILGLAVFLGVHMVRVVAPEWRKARIEGIGEGLWKGLYSLISLVGLALILWGYAMAHEDASLLYDEPVWWRSLSLIVNPIALATFMAGNLPAGYIKRAVGHPMLWGTILWSLVHLVGNGDSASVLLFGSLFIWAVVDLISAYSRPQPNHSDPAIWPDAASVAIAAALTWFLLSGGHAWLFGAGIA